MRRLAALLLALLLLCGSASGAEEKYVALTFDDGPSGRFTRRLLEGLEQRQAQATFFLCGYRLEQYPNLAEKILEGGHEIGLHGYCHDSMANMSCAQLARELDDTAALLEAQTGEGSVLLRPPGGEACSRLVEATKARGLSIIQWSVDPKDWATSNKDAVIRRVLEAVDDGDIILLHDMSDSSVDAALEIVDALTARGYRFVTVSRLAELCGTELQPGAVYYQFDP